MAYFINLFTEETWREIREHGWTVTGHTERLRNRDEIRPGDVFLCYVTKVSAFVGALEVVGDFEEVGPDGERIWKKELFPLRFPVKLASRVPITAGVTLESARLNSEDPTFWRWVFRNSGNRIPDLEGDWILSELRSRSQLASDEDEPTNQSLTEPENGQGSTRRHRVHSQTQLELAVLGKKSGFDVWIARNDRSTQVGGQTLGDLSVTELPDGFPRQELKTVELIDVLWIRRRTYVAAFEVETTTPIFTGMLRMADLIAAQPNISIPLYLVAPEERRARVFEQLTRPLFRYGLDRPLEDVCQFVAIESLHAEFERYSGAPGLDGKVLIESLAESAQ